ncbi:MAG: L-lactate dehydrogenase [Lachnospiraceae bacterium]
MNLSKAGIIGCGFVGATIAYTLMQSPVFREMVLIDIDKNKAEGEAMDLNHGIPFARPIKIYSGDYSDLKDAGVIIITAGAGQKPGETRLDLVNKNVELFKKIIPAITKHVKDAILLVVSNPVDILTWVTLKLSGFKESHVIGSGTVLDSGRLKYVIGEHLSVDPRSVHAFIIGEHGDSEVTAWSSVNVSGIPVNQFCEMRGYETHEENRNKLSDMVKNSAYEIIDRKGATYYGIAMATRRICESIVHNEKSILTVSSMQHHYYEADGVCIGMPCVIGNDGVEQVVCIDLDGNEAELLKNSVNALNNVIESINI